MGQALPLTEQLRLGALTAAGRADEYQAHNRITMAQRPAAETTSIPESAVSFSETSSGTARARQKSEIRQLRNPKSEIRNKFESGRKSNARNGMRCCFGHCFFA